MKHVDYLYFNIYNYFYRVSQERPTANPRLQAMCLFSLGSGGWLLLFESIYLHFIKHTRFVSPMQSMIFATSIYALTAFFFHYIFIIRDRDLRIFGHYEEMFLQNPKKKQHFIVSLSVLAMPYLILSSFAVIFPRH